MGKIEPPSWFIGHTLNPIQVLITGEKLIDASVTVDDPGIKAGKTRVSANGTYLFTEFTISQRAKAGRATVHIKTNHGSARVDFILQNSLKEEGNFRGFDPDDVIYLIMIDRFANGDPANDNPPGSKTPSDRSNPRAYHGGDLQGIVNQLDYLKDLGATAIWITPVYDNPDLKSVYHGYHAVDFYSIEEHFGTLEKFRELVEKAHARGIKIIQDQVANHVGPTHSWVTNPPAPDWFNGTAESHQRNNFDIAAIVDPYANPADRMLPLNGWFANRLPDLNQNNPDLARYLIQNALWWVDQTGLDGIRQDTFPYVPRNFWWRWNEALTKQHPNLKVVGEVSGTKPFITSFFQGGVKRWDSVDSGLYTVFDFPLAAAMRHVFVKDHPMIELMEVLSQDWLYADPSVLVTFFGNHDWSRFLTEAKGDVQKLKLAATFLLTIRGIPQLYYGDEIGMEGSEDPDNRRDFLGSHSWPQVESQLSDLQKQTRTHFRKLMHLRQEHEALRRGKLIQLMADKEGLIYMRSSSNEQVIVAVNNAGQPRTISVPRGHLDLKKEYKLINLLNPEEAILLDESEIKIKLGPKEGKLFLVVHP